jgi:hypothetical protein
MTESTVTLRSLLATAAAVAVAPSMHAAESHDGANLAQTKETKMKSVTFTKTQTPEWLLTFWKEIDDKTWGKGFDCFAENAAANLGVSD